MKRDVSLLLSIGFADSYGTKMRNKALVELGRSAGIPVRAKYIKIDVLAGNETQQALPAISDILKSGYLKAEAAGGSLGILAANDLMARWILEACNSLGLEIPQQVAVVGVDDSPLAFCQRPTITSVMTPGDEVGYRATEVITRILAGKAPAGSPVLVPATSIAVRESTGGSSEWPDNMSLALDLIRRQAFSGKNVEEITASLPISGRTLQRLFR